MRVWRAGAGFLGALLALGVSSAAAGESPPPSPCCREDSLAAAEEISGAARVVDANTLEIGSRRVRLIGVDAPDLEQTCPVRKGGTYPCGRVAAETLAKLVHDGPLVCRGEKTDEIGRILARCAIRGFDLGEQFVLTGRAFADPETGGAYRRAEGTAEKLREGMWRGEFEKPWEWRHARGVPAAK